METEKFNKFPNQTAVQFAEAFKDRRHDVETLSPNNNPKVFLWRAYPSRFETTWACTGQQN